MHETEIVLTENLVSRLRVSMVQLWFIERLPRAHDSARYSTVVGVPTRKRPSSNVRRRASVPSNIDCLWCTPAPATRPSYRY